MRKVLAVAAAALLFPMAASAQLSVGASIGLGFPMGDAADGFELKSQIKSAVPLEVYANFGLAPNVDVGAYLGYHKGVNGDDLQDYCDFFNLDCSTYGWRLGVQGEYGLAAPGASMIPFVGASFGWAWETEKEELGGDWYKGTLSGWEIGLKGGADMALASNLKVGAFIGLAFGKFGKFSEKCSSDSVCTDFDDDIPSDAQAMHQWLTLGVRGTFGL